jgi:hypothetical protein
LLHEVRRGALLGKLLLGEGLVLPHQVKETPPVEGDLGFMDSLSHLFIKGAGGLIGWCLLVVEVQVLDFLLDA